MRRASHRERRLLDCASREMMKARLELPDPFDGPYVCRHCDSPFTEFTGPAFEQQDTGAPICPECWRAGRR